MRVWYMQIALTTDAECLVDDNQTEDDYINLLLGERPYLFTTKAQAIAHVSKEVAIKMQGMADTDEEGPDGEDPTEDDLWLEDQGLGSEELLILNVYDTRLPPPYPPEDANNPGPGRLIAIAQVGSAELHNG